MKTNEDEEAAGKFIALPSNNDHHTDGLTLVVGEAGPFQWTAAVLTGLCITTHSLAMLSNKWLTMSTDYWCQRPPAYQ